MQTVCVCTAFAPAEVLMCYVEIFSSSFFPWSNYTAVSLIGGNVVLGEEKKKCSGYTFLEIPVL